MTHNQAIALCRLAGNSFSASIPNRTLNSLVSRGLVEKTGDHYHTLTEEGATVVYEYEIRQARKFNRKG